MGAAVYTVNHGLPCYHDGMSTAALLQLPLFSDPTVEGGWRVRRSARARRLSVRVFRDGGVEIVAPQRVTAPQIGDFVARHRPWIERQLLRSAPVDCRLPPPFLELRAAIERWPCDPAVRQAGVLERLTARAHELLAPQLQELAVLMGVSFQRLQIRRQRTRWGSCSTRGTISLNCCLLFQRPQVVRYLLVHELAHLRHMNHGERFWSLVERFEPHWRALDRELSQGWSQVPGWLLARSAQ
jgi:predicted metal-dependent hydrolase